MLFFFHLNGFPYQVNDTVQHLALFLWSQIRLFFSQVKVFFSFVAEWSEQTRRRGDTGVLIERKGDLYRLWFRVDEMYLLDKFPIPSSVQFVA